MWAVKIIPFETDILVFVHKGSINAPLVPQLDEFDKTVSNL